MKDVVIYCDGACKGNPGVGGYGVVIKIGELRQELKGGYRHTTNNRMEMIAAIKALEVLIEPSNIALYSDSAYLVNTMCKGWKKKANFDLWEILDNLAKKHTITFHWVRGHSGNVENERCDSLANLGIHGALQIDEGYFNGK